MNFLSFNEHLVFHRNWGPLGQFGWFFAPSFGVAVNLDNCNDTDPISPKYYYYALGKRHQDIQKLFLRQIYQCHYTKKFIRRKRKYNRYGN